MEEHLKKSQEVADTLKVETKTINGKIVVVVGTLSILLITLLISYFEPIKNSVQAIEESIKNLNF